MFDRGVRARGAVDVDPVADLPSRPHAAEADERHAALGEPRLARVAALGAAEDEAVDLVLVEEFLVPREGRTAGRGGEQQDR